MANRERRALGRKGVTKKPNGKWVAQISCKYIGIYATQEEAKKAYDNAAKIKFGEFARTNEMLSGL